MASAPLLCRCPPRGTADFLTANKLIEAALADPFAGIGKPEPLKHKLAGHWSRRITQEHRLIYYVTDTEIVVIQVAGHYNH